MYLLANFLHIIRQQDGAQKTILSKPYGLCDELVTADVNGDQQPEIAIQYQELELISPSTGLKIWSITPTGDLQPISLKNVEKDLDLPYLKKSIIGLGGYKTGNTALFSQQSSVTPEGTITLRKFYDWDERNKVYKFTGSAKTLEKHLD